MRNMYNGKHYSLPPKSSFPTSIASLYADYAQNAYTSGSQGVVIIPKYRGGNSLHQRTSSESLVIEEQQPSWLDELLDEPETPVKRGHRRSSSDSFTYMEAANANIEQAAQLEYRLRNKISESPWGSQSFDYYKDDRNASYYTEQNPRVSSKIQVWESPQNALPRSTSLGASRDINRITTVTTKKQESVETRAQDSKTDSNRSKQQVAQRSRVRKLQYIAELERNVQTLQAEGCKVSGELKFLNQRSLILTMENKALKQRLENLAHEQLIRYLEQEVLEKEIKRLRALYKQQQPPPTEASLLSHQRTSSMESQFANLSLNNKEGAMHDALLGPLHI